MRSRSRGGQDPTPAAMMSDFARRAHVSRWGNRHNDKPRSSMPGGGVGSSQTIVLSTRYGVNVNSLTSTLQRLGVSYLGAQAFAQGNLVESIADRRALASLFSDAVDQLGSR
jgi:hypothetical protein